MLEVISKDNGKILSKYKDKYKIDDIEKLLTLLDLEATESDEIKNDRSAINAEIVSYFRKFRFSKFGADIPLWLKTFALNVLKRNDAIVYLNYDCFLEGALDKLGVWSPNDGYAGINNFPTDSLPKNPENIKIYKIHGSENFIESTVKEFPVIGENPKQTAIGVLINSAIYPKTSAHSCYRYGTINSKLYIIAPSFVKIPHRDIAAMMLDLMKVAEVATDFVIIGCGMRPEDNFLWLLLTCFLNRISNPKHRLVILDPSSEKIRERISNYWIGDIRQFDNIVTIPCKLEDGISKLNRYLNKVEN